MDRDVLFRLSDQVLLEADLHSQGGILMDGRDAALFTCNESAWLVAGLLQQGAGFADLLAAVLEAFEVSEEQAKQDIRLMLKKLQALNLLAKAEAL